MEEPDSQTSLGVVVVVVQEGASWAVVEEAPSSLAEALGTGLEEVLGARLGS